MPLIADNLKAASCSGFRVVGPVRVTRSFAGSHAVGLGAGLDVLDGPPVAVGEPVGSTFGLADPLALALAPTPALAEPVAFALGLADPETRALGLAVTAAEVAEVATIGLAAGGGDGLAFTALPLLVPLTIKAIITARTRMAPPTTTTRRRQYVWDGSGPTGWSTALMTRSLGRRPPDRGQARREGAVPRAGTVAGVAEPGAVPTPGQARSLVSRILRWYDSHARDLPWRHPGTSPWAVLVSEVMLQQTPVERVRAPWQTWLERWPTPDSLAAAPPGEAVRAWGRLGYPRRALRLHQAAVAITERFGGEVPADEYALRSLPGVGDYTAAAVASFAFRRRAVVLDTNVRRVLARTVFGEAHPGPIPTRAEYAVAAALAPRHGPRAARWAVASMELGALVCTARAPRCTECPVRTSCAWFGSGRPAGAGPPRRGQTYDGTDRQCRGALLSVLRSADGPVPSEELDAAWLDPAQRFRALESLLADGLVETVPPDRFALPQ